MAVKPVGRTLEKVLKNLFKGQIAYDQKRRVQKLNPPCQNSNLQRTHHRVGGVGGFQVFHLIPG